MNKKFCKILCLIGVLILSISACNNGKTKESNQTETEEKTAIEEETEEVPFETEETAEIVSVEEEEEETEAPTPIPPTQTPKPPVTYRDTDFPIGKFTSDSGSTTLYLRADGSCLREGLAYVVECLYGVNGNLYSEMFFVWPFYESQTPATYTWEFDGSHLIFALYGIDRRPLRSGDYDMQTYTYAGPSFLGTEIQEDNFPRGRFVSQDGLRAFEFDEDGSWRFFDGDMENPALSGKYAINGEYYTEMTHDNQDYLQIPATYLWAFDGQNLSFELWGEDEIAERAALYDQQTYILVED